MLRRLFLLVSSAVFAGALVSPAVHASPSPSVADRHVTYTSFDSQRDFVRGSWSGVEPGRGGTLVISPRSRNSATYTDPFGGAKTKTYDTGSWTSPVTSSSYGATEAIASWNATTPTGTFVETTFRGQHADGSWTKWYVLGRWASGDDFDRGDIHRISLDGQRDEDGTVYTDTFAAKSGREVTAHQTRVTLLRPAGSRATPTLSAIGTMTSAVPDGHPEPVSGFTLGRATELKVPRFSQNIHEGEYPEYGGGGEVWCSPTATSMVQYFWGRKHQVPRSELDQIVAPNGDPQIGYAARKTWDYTYEGAGNWPFNAAYASTFGLESFVTRLRSLAEAEKFIAAGIPVVASLSFTREEMPEAGYATNGHLLVIVGFTEDGDPVINDPASSSNAAVRNVYTRENFEKVWIGHSGGVSYIFHPNQVKLPRTVSGLEHNW